MLDTTRAERLLALFTSPDRAAAIAGDLTEESRQRGSIWFWPHVVRIMLALWRSASAEAPLAALALTVAGCALFAVPAFVGAAAVNLFPEAVRSPVSWIALSFFWWGGALWTGASLVAIAPRGGMAACVTLAVAGEALLIAFVGTALWSDLPSVQLGLYCATGLVAAAPLLIGGAMARRRMIAWGVPFLEH